MVDCAQIPTQLTIVVLTLIGVILLYYGTAINQPMLIVISVLVLLGGFIFMIMRSKSGIGYD
jgi:hypothetical protein